MTKVNLIEKELRKQNEIRFFILLLKKYKYYDVDSFVNPIDLRKIKK